jgi:predicted RNase H-like HicB family nuclease
MRNFVAYIERDPETNLYVGIIPNIPGAHTQGETLDELQKNLKEVLELCLEEMTDDERMEMPEFVGVQQVEVAI